MTRLHHPRTALAAFVTTLFGLAIAEPPLVVTPPSFPPADSSEAEVEDSRIVVKTIDDLPRRTHRIEGTVRELFSDHDAVRTLAEAIEAGIRADFDTHRITDPNLLKGRYEFLQNVELLRGDLDAALEWTWLLRDLDDKRADRLMRGVVLEALVEARRRTTNRPGEFDAEFRKILRERVDALPYDEVQGRLMAARMAATMATAAMIEEGLVVQLEPILAATGGELSEPIAMAIVVNRVVVDTLVPILPTVGSVYGEIIDANSDRSPARDIWSERLVALDADERAAPVTVAIWDTGVDLDLFPGQRAGESASTPAGIAFDADHRDVPELLRTLDGLHGDRHELVEFLAAMSDLQAGVDSDGVVALREHMRTLAGDDLRRFLDDMSLLGNWSHGTHVAGIVADGNPFVRLFVVRESFPHELIPVHAPTIERYRAWGESAERAVEAMKAADVRVVNMSWRVPRSSVEAMLEAKGVGESPAHRAELSRVIFAEFRDRLHDAIAGAPEILFIAGSGNEDNDVDVNEYVPAGFRLPNLITVGAVDGTGRMTSFTSVGEGVQLYANGDRIESVIPGGRRVRFSGTSMSAPQVANLAAKLLAIDPTLTVDDLVHRISVNGDMLAEDPSRTLIHPRRSIEHLRLDL